MLSATRRMPSPCHSRLGGQLIARRAVIVSNPATRSEGGKRQRLPRARIALREGELYRVPIPPRPAASQMRECCRSSNSTNSACRCRRRFAQPALALSFPLLIDVRSRPIQHGKPLPAKPVQARDRRPSVELGTAWRTAAGEVCDVVRDPETGWLHAGADPRGRTTRRW